MASLRTSEIFTSIEGEGIYTGQPTLFVRVWGCNFRCMGFANPTGEILSYKGYKTLTSIKQVTKLEKGCDSAYSWSPDAAHLTVKWQVPDLAVEIGRHAVANKFPRILSLTGGEPTLFQEQFAELITILAGSFEVLLIESNASLPLEPVFLKALEAWARVGGRVVFSNSPKLTLSGEPREKAWRPDVVFQQLMFLSKNIQWEFIQCVYFKFVVDGSDEAVEEVELYMKQYEEYAKSQNVNTWVSNKHVWLMPVGDTEKQMLSIARKVAQQCLDKGFNFCYRVHVSVWGDEVGR